jgi:ribosomal subunit interface protein
MSLRISGKNIDIGEALRARISGRITDATAKYFDGGFSGHVTVGKEGYGFRTECVIHLDSGIVLEADAHAPDAYASADQAAIRIEKRLRRYKRRLKEHQPARADVPFEASLSEPQVSGSEVSEPQARTDRGARDGAAADPTAIAAASYVIAAPSHDEEEADFDPVIIAETTMTMRRLSVSEAVAELDMTGVPVVVFRHAGHGRVNLVYRRADGHIGWIDPPTIDRDSH